MWGGLSCFSSAAALYLLGKSSVKDAEVLRSVATVSQLKDLVVNAFSPQLLETACRVLPLVVTISGLVCYDAPINYEYSGLRGQMDSALMLSMSKEVPWQVKLFLLPTQGATGLALTIANEVFQESARSLARGTLDDLQGLSLFGNLLPTLGVMIIERVLPTGTSLTIVAEVILWAVDHLWHTYLFSEGVDRILATPGISCTLGNLEV
ncbi:hypothetical protein MKW94_000120, partial [Papaver nudicaule]|nr:hypothetical protein [Papaver nudicaule]